MLLGNFFQNDPNYMLSLPPESAKEKQSVEDSDAQFNKLISQKKTPSKKVR